MISRRTAEPAGPEKSAAGISPQHGIQWHPEEPAAGVSSQHGIQWHRSEGLKGTGYGGCGKPQVMGAKEEIKAENASTYSSWWWKEGGAMGMGATLWLQAWIQAPAGGIWMKTSCEWRNSHPSYLGVKEMTEKNKSKALNRRVCCVWRGWGHVTAAKGTRRTKRSPRSW